MPSARDHGAPRATPDTSRRNLLAGASAALVAGAAATVAAHGAPAAPSPAMPAFPPVTDADWVKLAVSTDIPDQDMPLLRMLVIANGSKAPVRGRALLAAAREAERLAALEPADPGAPDDAELVALLAQLHQDHAKIAAIEAEGDHLPDGITDASRDQERRLEDALDQREETWNRIIATPARTPAGMRAKAEALGMVVQFYAYAHEGDTLEEIATSGDARNRMALSLARDVLAGEAVA